MYGKLSLQAKNLQNLLEKKACVMVYLINGTKQRGQLVGFSERCIFLQNGTTQIITKNIVQTVIPT